MSYSSEKDLLLIATSKLNLNEKAIKEKSKEDISNLLTPLYRKQISSVKQNSIRMI